MSKGCPKKMLSFLSKSKVGACTPKALSVTSASHDQLWLALLDKESVEVAYFWKCSGKQMSCDFLPAAPKPEIPELAP